MRGIILLFLLGVFYSTFAQEQFGLNRPSLRWYQIQTPTGKVIYPEGCDSIAFRSAGIMQYELNHDTTIIGTGKIKRVPVIIQNQSTLPAGFSTPAPWRNEYYIAPPQNLFLGPVNWMDGLTMHEYRHTQQFVAGHGGFTGVYKVVMGQTGWLLNTLFTQPLWFREGDAVTYETLLSRGGRGRLPSFHMEYRAMRLSGYHYNYEKAHYSSFKNYVPNAYRLGYYMVSKGRRDYGQELWQKVLHDAYYKKGFFYSFSRSLQKYTGLGTVGLYKSTVAELDSMFIVTDNALKLTEHSPYIRHDENVYTNWRFPHWTSDTSVVVLKQGFKDIYTYYLEYANGSEERLFIQGQYTDDHITTVVEGDLMTWAETGYHERWINEDYSVIKLYNLKTKKHKKLSSKTRYFSPAPSHSGKEIATVYIDKYNTCEIHFLDVQNGKLLRTFPLPKGMIASHTRWVSGDEQLVMIVQNADGNTIALMNVQNGELTYLQPFTDVPLTRPFPKGDYIYYSAGTSGINNIYAERISDRTIFQITSVRFGAFEPVVSADGKSLLYSEYTADGYKTMTMALSESSFMPVQTLQSDIRFLDKLEAFDGNDLTKVNFTATYTPKKFHALTSGLFNLYGWIPLPNVPEYGAEFYTQNIMSTTRGTFGYLYNTNEKNSHFYAKIAYAALYPWLEFEVDYGPNRKVKTINEASKEVRTLTWTDHFVSMGARIPFRLTQGVYTTKLSIGAWAQYYDVSGLDTTAGLDVTSTNNFFAGKTELIFSRLRTQARLHVKPRWGQALNVSFQKALDDLPQRFVATALLYFPGAYKTHSLNFLISYKNEEVVDVYRFKDNFLMPRGYLTTPMQTIYGVATNYEFPIWYPDLSAGPVAQFQRLRMNVFCDYSVASSLLYNNKPLASTGSELLIDFRLFRLCQVTMGFRYNYTFDNTNMEVIPFQFIIPRFEIAN